MPIQKGVWFVMDDIISRQAAIDLIMETDPWWYEGSTRQIFEGVKQLPSAQRKGKWVYDDEAYPGGNPYGHYECDQCAESVPHKTNYCPNCGAYMRERSEDETD